MEFLLGVIASLTATGVAYYAARSRKWIASSPSKRTMKLARRLHDLGMTNFFASRADYAVYRPPGRITDYLATAQHRIDIAAYWMGHGNESEATPRRIVDILEKNRSLHVRIAMINPDGPALALVAQYLDLTSDDLKNRLLSSLDSLVRARAHASAHAQARLQVLVYSTIPAASVIILDYGHSSARIQLDFKPFKKPRSDSFAFELQPPSALFTTCSEAWIQVVDEAKPYSPIPASLDQPEAPATSSATERP